MLKKKERQREMTDVYTRWEKAKQREREREKEKR